MAGCYRRMMQLDREKSALLLKVYMGNGLLCISYMHGSFLSQTAAAILSLDRPEWQLRREYRLWKERGRERIWGRSNVTSLITHWNLT